VPVWKIEIQVYGEDPSVEDENADRVYVPGNNPTPPDRDVEPFWAEDELEAPVHGKPVPHEAPPAIPLPPQTGVYRPTAIPQQSAHPPIPIPPPAQQFPSQPPQFPPPSAPPTQAWPNLEPGANPFPDPSTGYAPQDQHPAPQPFGPDHSGAHPVPPFGAAPTTRPAATPV
jgi:hypothetical protein